VLHSSIVVERAPQVAKMSDYGDSVGLGIYAQGPTTPNNALSFQK